MGIKTGIIRYNLRERGRRHRGLDRNFDTVAAAALINGPELQERVKNGDLLGYYGHYVREKFGMDVGEGRLVGSKMVHIEPALRTISIRADADGWVEHEAEFLDTAPGRLSARMFNSKAGGFSSAITAPKRGSVQVPKQFHGFDYVLEPNYTTNRGYTLDSAGNRVEIGTEELSDEELAVFDDVAQYNGLVDATNAVLDRVQGEFNAQAEVLLALQQETIEYQGIIARMQVALDSAKTAQDAAVAAALAAAAVQAPPPVITQEPVKPEDLLDSTALGTIRREHTHLADADSFLNAPLHGYQSEDKPVEPPTKVDRHFARAFGIGRR